MTLSSFQSQRVGEGEFLARSNHCRDLALLGAKGCLLAVGPDFPFAAPTDASGAASVKLSIPNDQGLVRGKLWWQWLPVDKQANQLGFTVSNFGRVLMGL